MTAEINQVPELEHPDKNVRIARALELGERGDRSALDGLIRGLRDDPDFFVRETVTWALLRLGEVAVEPLARLTDHDSPRVRHDALHALSKLGYQHAILAIWERLSDSDERVVAKAAYALGVLRERGAIPELISLLSHDSTQIRTTSVEALERLGPLATEELAAAISEANATIRRQVAEVLGGIGGDAAVEALRQGLDDEHWSVRVAVLMALSRIDSDVARRAIATAHRDDDRRVRAVAQRLTEDAS